VRGQYRRVRSIVRVHETGVRLDDTESIPEKRRSM